jgi:hypothetical protein
MSHRLSLTGIIAPMSMSRCTYTESLKGYPVFTIRLFRATTLGGNLLLTYLKPKLYDQVHNQGYLAQSG